MWTVEYRAASCTDTELRRRIRRREPFVKSDRFVSVSFRDKLVGAPKSCVANRGLRGAGTGHSLDDRLSRGGRSDLAERKRGRFGNVAVGVLDMALSMSIDLSSRRAERT